MTDGMKPASGERAHNIVTCKDELLARINAAVAAANDAKKNVTTAQAELVSRSKEVGALLLEAKKLHPSVMDFEAFLRKVHGLRPSRAYDCMRVAGGRTTDEEIRKATRDRVKKHRRKKKLHRAKPELSEVVIEPVSVTSGGVTESPAEVSADKRKAEYASAEATPKPSVTETAEEMAVKVSRHSLAEFMHACNAYLPKLIETDLERARAFFASHVEAAKAEMQKAA